MTADSRFDPEEVTQDIPLPLSDANRYTALFDSARGVVCDLSLHEDLNPGAVAAFKAWATANGLTVATRTRDGRYPCVAYEVEIPPPDRHWIRVYSREAV